MIVTCPACDTRYLVDEAALGGDAGRRLRCASCGNSWHYSAEAAAIYQAILEATAAATETAAAPLAPAVPTAAPSQVELVRGEVRAEGQAQAEAPAAAVGRLPVPVDLPGAARRRTARMAGFGLLALAAAVLLVVLVARNPIVAMFPSTTAVFQTLHLIAPPGRGLAVTDLTPTRTTDSLKISGDIVNHGTVETRLPRLRVTLRDGGKSDLESQVIDPPVDRLMPGTSAHFTAVFDHPSITAVQADVNFVTN